MLATALATTALCRLYLIRRDAARADQTARILAHAVAQIATQSVRSADIDRAVAALVERPENAAALKAIAVRDRSGRLFGLAAHAPGYEGRLAPPESAEPGPVRLRRFWNRGPDGAIRRLRQIDTEFDATGDPNAPASIACLVEVPNEVVVSQTAIAFTWSTVIAGLLGIGIACWPLHNYVAEPIDSLREAIATRSLNAGLDALAARNDEIASIIQGIAGLQTELNEARNEADRAHRQIDSRVAERTATILRELHRAQKTMWQDPLTGLKNRRALDEKLSVMFEAQRDAEAELSIVMFDLDHFKTINDTLGHPAGDRVLRFVGLLLRQFQREGDLAIRFGGDEFLVILPGISREHAEHMARRITGLFSQYAMLMQDLPVRPAMSYGIAELKADQPADAQELLALADRNMYRRKQACRTSPSFGFSAAG
ncbi:MAG: GGDEF domain-containing protein [Phycisphaerae bacterium]|nr:GGDEF domain-containing protein [Phycisphaerae bacterium]